MNEEIRLAQVSQLVRDIRRVYAVHKEQRMGVKYRPRADRDRAEFFQAAANQALSLGVTAEEYVQACFDYCMMAEGPFVNALGGQAAARWVNQMLSERRAGMAARAAVTATPAVSRPKPRDPQEALKFQTEDTVKFIKDAIIDAQFSVAKATGLTLGAPGFVEAIATEGLMHCICRPLLGGLTPEIRRRFGYEVDQYLKSNQAVPAALTEMGYDVRVLWAWLQSGEPLL